MANNQSRRFRMNEQLLYDVIRRQAGTLQKAIMEGVMNARDAHASRCDITLGRDQVVIKDDGHGFQSRQEIEDSFEEFGKPHDSDEQASKTYGRFRMGRGQLFAYGYNLWRSGYWRMQVDVQNWGLDYKLEDLKTKKKGCEVTVAFYEPLSLSGYHEVVRTLTGWVKYTPMTVTVNDADVTTDPESEKWDHVLDEAYIRLDDTQSLTVYNQGIYTMDLPAARYGRGGVVVTRQPVQVNFARNDIQDSCPVWNSIRQKVDELASRKNSQGTLDDAGRQRFADKVVESGDFSTYRKYRLITAVTGRNYSLGRLIHARVLTVAPRGNRLGDRLMKSNTAFVVAQETLERFHCQSLQELVDMVVSMSNYPSDMAPAVHDFEALTEHISADHELLGERSLTSKERVWLELARSMANIMTRASLSGDPRESSRLGHHRTVAIGLSDTANGWTDGTTYVAIDRRFLQNRDFTIQGLTDLAWLLIHEGCHDVADTGEHDHDQEFYERFHDTVERSMALMIAHVFTELPSALKRHNRRMTKRMLRQQDRAEEISKGREEFDKTAASFQEV